MKTELNLNKIEEIFKKKVIVFDIKKGFIFEHKYTNTILNKHNLISKLAKNIRISYKKNTEIIEYKELNLYILINKSKIINKINQFDNYFKIKGVL